MSKDMTVEKVIEQLEKLDPKSIVYVARDEEGNDFHKLFEIQGEYQAVVLWPDSESQNPLG